MALVSAFSLQMGPPFFFLYSFHKRFLIWESPSCGGPNYTQKIEKKHISGGHWSSLYILYYMVQGVNGHLQVIMMYKILNEKSSNSVDTTRMKFVNQI